jgi:hypothetical protein
VPEVTRICALCPTKFVTGDSVRGFSDGFAHEACITKWVAEKWETRRAATPLSAPLPPEKHVKHTPDKSATTPQVAKALPPQSPAFDSKLEQAYWLHLQRQVHAGEIRRADHHVEKLFLGEGSWYTPDFRVIATDGTVEFHETKGFMREAARVRLLVAATTHPYRFFLVKNKGSTKTPVWEILRVGSGID